MKQVLVIGGSGHVSGAVVRAALADGYKVYTLTRGNRPAVGQVVELSYLARTLQTSMATQAKGIIVVSF